MARLGILGLPNTGKTTVFNALTGLAAPTAAHPYSTIEPNVGVAVVPDESLDRAAGLEGSAKTVHATLELLDLPAMARAAAGGGLGAQFLGRLREMDALLVVLRQFDDEAVPDDDSGLEPLEQAEELLLELTLSDAEAFERRIERLAKEATADPSKKPLADAVSRALELLSTGKPLRSATWEDEALRAFRDTAPLTLKPAVWVINTSEEVVDAESLVASVESVVPAGDTVVALSARLEEEAVRLGPEDRRELFEGLGMGEGALVKVVHAAYEALGLVSFYTLGPKEAHAWTVRRGARAPEAAGKIHTDMQRGFIRAEVAGIDAVVTAGGWDAAKKSNLVRVEGKEYVVRERDVIVVRFSI